MISIEDFEIHRVYRHFKGNYYYVMNLAQDTETNKLMVVYHALYGDYKIYVRPYATFVEELNDYIRSLYNQKYRFEPATLE